MNWIIDLICRFSEKTAEGSLLRRCAGLLAKYREVLNYLFFGVLTTLVNLVSYFVLTRAFHINYIAATAIAWVLSVLFAYVTNKIWVFESRDTAPGVILRELISFVGCRLFSGALDMGIMYLCVSVWGMPDGIIKILSNILVIVLNYIFSKLLIFRKGK
ncbi:MAG: GtrA family protein [Oscillospiraceae bacterium]|nr:GtrA family protein [Oscillospiraceae bacterium]